ncbi:MAG TPA: tRNA (adenosine(37)-N6)-threonylcarbamoyltransferase complex ATPase subunit type 1 TsaE [Stellaceae bacterium]|nr:tRNA (adenosine(37)-N6)-threonylcarbamoyltransferase complex ATPase subunit type 1 TsaE [Stellaceae bacterium]
MPSALAIELPSEGATAALAARLAGLARAGDVIALKGPLGSGKTTFARAFIRARLGTHEEVPSPTFTLVETYGSVPPQIWHFDLFRLERPEDVWELGIEDALAGGISLIEWPERMGALLPRERLEIEFAFGAAPDARTAVLAPSPSWAGRIGDPLV